MSKLNKLILDYCGNDTNVWNDELHTFGGCFLFTLIEIPVYFVSLVVIAYMIGNLRQPDELDRVLHGLRYREKTNLFFLFLELLTISVCILCNLVEKLDYYGPGHRYDGNAMATMVVIKLATLSFLAVYILKSMKCFNYSFCRLIAMDLILTGLITVEILNFGWLKVNMRIFTFLDERLLSSHLKLISTFLYFAVYNLEFFVTKRHSLYYESFANYDSSFNLDTIANLNGHRKGLVSMLFFSWVQPFLIKAANDQVRNEADIFHLPEALKSEHVKGRVFEVYKSLVIRDLQDDYPELNSLNFDTTSSHGNTDDQTIEPVGSVHLRKVLWTTYKAELFRVSNLKLIADIFAFLSPILLNKLIDYLDSKDFSASGFVLVLSLIACQVISSVAINLYDFLINNICIKVKSTVVNIVYRKMFSLRTSTLHNNFSNGQLVNFSSLDADRIANFFSSFFLLFSMPLQVFVALFLLYQQIGYSFIAGLIFSILLLGINKFISFRIALITDRLLSFKDQRIKLTSKLITGIKTIKMNHWDDIFTKQIDEVRQKEIQMLRRKKMLDAVCVYFWAITPVVTSFLTFSTFVLVGNKLTASNVFTSLALLNMLINPLNSLPWVFTGVLESWISSKRIEAFLRFNCGEDLLSEQTKLDEENELRPTDPEHAVKFDDVSFKYNADGFLLGPIDLNVKNGELIGLIGPVGSGKTSFLNAILNELEKERSLEPGKIELNLSKKGICYVAQIPWLQNDTVRNNILFGKSYEYKRYHDVVDACDLRKDFETFKDYDNELISDQGSSLSGGQKTRIALARALYQNLDLYLIDDPFSSLDQQVGTNINENCILKYLSSKTRIVCTNQYEYLKKADRVVVMENGCVKRVGKPEEVLNDLLQNPLSAPLTKEKTGTQLTESTADTLPPTDNQFTEEFNKGKVSPHIYHTYIKAIGIPLSICIVAFLMAMQSSSASSSVWLSYWTNRLKIDVKTDSMEMLKVLLFIMLANSLLAAFRAVLFALGCISAARNLYDRLYRTVIRLKLSFFTVRPIGQILNRFASDIGHIDENLPFTLNLFLANAVSLLATVIVTGWSVPISLVCLFLLSIPYYKICDCYRQGSMVLKRISTNTMSPLFSQFHETLCGLASIRSFRASQRFLKHFGEKVDRNNSANYSLKACSQWLNLRIQLIGICLTATIAMAGCFFHYYGFVQQTSLIALGLVYALSTKDSLGGLVWSFTQLEIDFVSVERLSHYFHNPEKEQLGMIKLIGDFPKHGKIIFDKVSFKYKSDSNFALDSLSFQINAGQFVGIVGRTGSGKSSIFATLFRLYDLDSGSIYIDDQNIKLLHLDTLRRGLYILTQDPFLFDGSIRDNLDPRKQLTDLQIWHAIDQCDAKGVILKLGGLNSTINDQESNLSRGEKQIICMIRALLCQVKILCLDEATSSLDQAMEEHICKTVKRAFARSTVLMISHRPSSCLNCDSVMVISDARLIEHDTPDSLLLNQSSVFHKMWLHQQNKM